MAETRRVLSPLATKPRRTKPWPGAYRTVQTASPDVDFAIPNKKHAGVVARASTCVRGWISREEPVPKFHSLISGLVLELVKSLSAWRVSKPQSVREDRLKGRRKAQAVARRRPFGLTDTAQTPSLCALS